jgi:hypothetical protein
VGGENLSKLLLFLLFFYPRKGGISVQLEINEYKTKIVQWKKRRNTNDVVVVAVEDRFANQSVPFGPFRSKCRSPLTWGLSIFHTLINESRWSIANKSSLVFKRGQTISDGWSSPHLGQRRGLCSEEFGLLSPSPNESNGQSFFMLTRQNYRENCFFFFYFLVLLGEATHCVLHDKKAVFSPTDEVKLI